jgi:hypothetical protein
VCQRVPFSVPNGTRSGDENDTKRRETREGEREEKAVCCWGFGSYGIFGVSVLSPLRLPFRHSGRDSVS